MKKVDLGILTSSAIVVSQVAAGVVYTEGISALPVGLVSDGTTVSRGIGKIDVPDSAENVSTPSQIPRARLERWTKLEKNRFRKLVAKFASSTLSKSDEEELRDLELARARFEDPRTPAEVIDEFKTRRRYAELITSLNQASVGLKR